MTPLENYPKLAEKLGLSNIHFKREDLGHYGSHKGRSIPFMIDYYYEKGDRKFAISSSGNAALAAILRTVEINSSNNDPVELLVFYGQNISPIKKARLEGSFTQKDNIRLLGKERPLQALHEATQEGYRSLRQSADDTAITGYQSLAEELDAIHDLGAVFIGTSSGTTAQALAQYFILKKRPVQIHIVQTSSCHPLSEQFGNYDGPSEKSIADAIVDQVALRRDKLVPLIRKTGGFGWVADNQKIETIQKIVTQETGLDISANSALSVVGAAESIYSNNNIEGKIVCLICGL